jgi:(S)-citramalyl-CoA lyase
MSTLRSLLFTPATKPDRFGKAASVGADVLIIDLEDSVAPRDKATARTAALRALLAPSPLPRALRINALGTCAGLADMAALLESGAQPEFLVVPKADSSAHVTLVAQLLQEGGCGAQLIGMIESARALQSLREIVSSTSRLVALMLGAADLAADLGCGPNAANLTRARIALIEAVSIAGIAALDSPFFDLRDAQGLQTATTQAVDLGFTGKAAIHPSQIEAINSAFTPTAEAVAQARAILLENESGVGQVNGKMIDEAVARQARRVLAAFRGRVRRLEALDEGAVPPARGQKTQGGGR